MERKHTQSSERSTRASLSKEAKLSHAAMALKQAFSQLAEWYDEYATEALQLLHHLSPPARQALPSALRDYFEGVYVTVWFAQERQTQQAREEQLYGDHDDAAQQDPLLHLLSTHRVQSVGSGSRHDAHTLSRRHIPLGTETKDTREERFCHDSHLLATGLALLARQPEPTDTLLRTLGETLIAIARIHILAYTIRTRLDYVPFASMEPPFSVEQVQALRHAATQLQHAWNLAPVYPRALDQGPEEALRLLLGADAANLVLLTYTKPRGTT